MADQTIDRDVPCVKCGYNLRTLSTIGHCPECGAGIGQSLAIPNITSYGRRWLMRVQIGMGMAVGSALFGMFYKALWLIDYLRLQSLEFLITFFWQGASQFFILLTWNFIAFACTWLITTPTSLIN